MSISTYADRNRLLRYLGFSTYQDYLGGPLWESVKKACRDLYGSKCFCGEPLYTFHHISYEREVLLGTDLSGLVPVCDKCHYFIEFEKSGKKRTLAGAKIAYEKRLAQSEKRKIKRLSRVERIGKRGWCADCGSKPKKGSDFCRLCLAKRLPPKDYTVKNFDPSTKSALEYWSTHARCLMCGNTAKREEEYCRRCKRRRTI